MSRRRIIWRVTNFDRKVIPVGIVPVASLSVPQSKFGFANLRHAQYAHDGIVEPFSSIDVSDGNGNVIEHITTLCYDRTPRACSADLLSNDDMPGQHIEFASATSCNC